MSDQHISSDAIERRRFWVSEIVKISGTFDDDSTRVESELMSEVEKFGLPSLLDHLRLCGDIPESYGHDTSEEKLYSKYTDILLAVAFRQIGLQSLVLTERADVADVEVIGNGYDFVADAKAFRLSRTAKNQKDFKIQAMDGWKHGKKYAVLVAPLYQLPNRSSQIYQQAIARDVCILSYSHLAILLRYGAEEGSEAAQELLVQVLQEISRLNPSKDSYAYWRAVNERMLGAGKLVEDLWKIEKQVTLESIAAAKEEGLRYLAEERARIMKLSRDEAIRQLIDVHKLDNRERQIRNVADTGLLDVRTMMD